MRAGRELQGPLETASDPEFLDDWQAVGRYTNVTVNGARHKYFILRLVKDTFDLSTYGWKRK